MKGRRDKWTDEEENILEKIVLEHLEIGSTKTAAFKKAANILGRTPAACGYRWNHVLSKKADTSTTSTQLQLPPPIDYHPSTPELTLDSVIRFLQSLKFEGATESQLEEKNRLLAERESLKKQQVSLEKDYNQKKEQYQKLLEQYESFAKVLDESEELIKEHVIH